MKRFLPYLIPLCLFFIIQGLFSSTRNLFQSMQQVTSLKQQVIDQKKENQFLSQQLYLANKPSFIEEQARTKLGLVYRGEELVITSPPPKPGKIVLPEEKENWEKWLQVGVRIGELANLRTTDVSDNALHIRAYEGHAIREVPLNKRAKEALKRYMAIRANTTDDHLFVTKTGKPFLVRNIRDAVERYFRKAGIEGAKINDLRHTFVAHHLKHGVSIVFLSKILGHKRLSSTERYLQYVPDNKSGNSTNLLEL